MRVGLPARANLSCEQMLNTGCPVVRELWARWKQLRAGNIGNIGKQLCGKTFGKSVGLWKQLEGVHRLLSQQSTPN